MAPPRTTGQILIGLLPIPKAITNRTDSDTAYTIRAQLYSRATAVKFPCFVVWKDTELGMVHTYGWD